MNMPGLQLMLEQLESHRLEVMLVPLNPRLRGYCEGGCKRVCVDVPPKWYRQLCRDNLSSRGIRRGKPDTKIKRRNVLRALTRLVDGRGYHGKYRHELLAVADRVAQGRLVSLLEGGYDLNALADSAAAHVRVLLAR